MLRIAGSNGSTGPLDWPNRTMYPRGFSTLRLCSKVSRGHTIVDHVDPAAFRKRAKTSFSKSFSVYLITSSAPAARASSCFGCCRYGAEHPSPKHLRNLRQKQTHTSGGRVYQNRVAVSQGGRCCGSGSVPSSPAASRPRLFHNRRRLAISPVSRRRQQPFRHKPLKLLRRRPDLPRRKSLTPSPIVVITMPAASIPGMHGRSTGYRPLL